MERGVVLGVLRVDVGAELLHQVPHRREPRVGSDVGALVLEADAGRHHQRRHAVARSAMFGSAPRRDQQPHGRDVVGLRGAPEGGGAARLDPVVAVAELAEPQLPRDAAHSRPRRGRAARS